MDTVLLTSLARRLSLTNFEVNEDYILTEEEERQVIAHHIERAKEHKRWKLTEQGFVEGDIQQRLADVDWSKEINREEILQRANSNKHYGIWQKKQRDNEKQEEEKRIGALREQWTAKQFLYLMQWTAENRFDKKFIIHDDNRAFITALCFFLSCDERFEKELGYSLKKGLMIRGIAGVGKTFIVSCAALNELCPISILSMIEITDLIKRDGEFHVTTGQLNKIYLDDVGTEEATVNHFGTKISFFKNFIEMYYLQNKPFNNLIISTNNSASEIEERYGFRVRSRMKDMFNVIDVHGKDMRG